MIALLFPLLIPLLPFRPHSSNNFEHDLLSGPEIKVRVLINKAELMSKQGGLSALLKRHSELFGRVGEGAHSIRIANLAVVDVGLTLVGSYWIHRLPAVQKRASIGTVTMGLFALGVIVHRLFGVRTTIDQLLFG